MSSIDAVIARSRMQGGGFSERKRFTVARSRGIAKMRKFALADPHHYVLELIQAAIANSAEWIDLQVEKERAVLSYIGGGLKEEELSQLFDFLFASKDRSDIGHVRELALGLNAAMLFQPDRIVVESGNLQGATRMVMHGDHDEVEIGKPDKPIVGTFISIEGMKRRKVTKSWLSGFDEDWPTEYGVIESRCLTAPIPIVVGGQPLFGWSSQRTPGVFGYKQALAFDEGDLYGTLGYKPTFGNPDFRLLTWGVAITSKRHDLIEGHPIGGIVCFDRLRKTVDHSGIVDDARLAELWERLRPYARQLVSGKKAASAYGATVLGGHAPLEPAQLRAMLRETKRVVIAPPGTASTTPAGWRAVAISQALQAPVLCVETDQLRVLPVLAGGELGIVQPDLDDDDDLELYRQPEASPPARPWLVSPIDAAPLPATDLAKRLGRGPLPADELADAIGAGNVRATVYTPAEAMAGASGLEVRVQTTGRVAWSGTVPSAYAGSVLVVELPHTPPSLLRMSIDEGPDAPTIGEEIARALADHAAPALANAFDRAVADLERTPDLQPGTAVASLGLAAAARSSVARLCLRDGRPGFELIGLGTTPAKILELPLLSTLDGQTRSLAEVAELATEGLVYGVIPEVPADLEGLDHSRILALSATDERLLVELIGDAAYVRVDARDVLASYRGVVVRDMALGLRPYPAFPLLVEGSDPSGWPEPQRAECLDRLLAQLALRFLGVEPARPEDPRAIAEWEECRRQACRHLQWAVVMLGDAVPDILGELPLLRDDDGYVYRWHTVRQALQTGRLPLLYGPGLGHAELGQLSEAALHAGQSLSDNPPRLVLAAPFLHRLLHGLGAHPAFEAPVDPGAPELDRGSLLCAVDVGSGDLRGHVGIARHARPAELVVVLPDGTRKQMPEIAMQYGMVGVVRVADDGQRRGWTPALQYEVMTALDAAGQQALSTLLTRARDSQPDGANLNRMLEVLLAYAGRWLTMRAQPDGRIEINVASELATQILGLPVFPSRFGGPVPAWRLVRRFVALVAGADADPTASVLRDLADALPPSLHAWITALLHPGNIARPPAQPARTPRQDAIAASPVHAWALLARTLEHWLDVLRPDETPSVRVAIHPGGSREAWIVGGITDVQLNADHWLLEWAAPRVSHDSHALAWLLLSTYAFINEVREPVTNDHERIFQLRVAEALTSGKLRLVQ